MIKNFNILPSHILFFLKRYVLSIFLFFVFRVLLFVTHDMEHIIQKNDFYLIKKSFLIGIQYDSVVLGYIFSLPAFVLTTYAFLKKDNRELYRFFNIYIIVLMSIAFLISSIDIPFFNYNFSRLSSVIFNWASDSSVILSMIIEESSYFLFVIIFILFIIVNALVSLKFFKHFTIRQIDLEKTSSKLYHGSLSLIFLALVFFAIRGRIDSPINIGHSFFCSNSFYNQLGLNPSFTLIKSLVDNNTINVLEDEVAVQNVKEYLGVKDKFKSSLPFARQVQPDDSIKKKNIVLVLMESMSADKMKNFGNSDNLTPFLDSLATVSLNFKNIYSAGLHTRNGIFSTLFSYPSVLRDSPMSSLNTAHFSSFPAVLKKNGYNNTYYTTHSDIFDNVGEFLPKNDFDKVVSQKNYDAKKVQNVFGVPDHVLFEYAIDDFDKKEEPFFSALMTISDHGPYIIPENISFKAKNENIKKGIVEYSDWSLKQFMKNASKTSWYKNTVFIFIADHGVIMGKNTYDIPLSLHHVPLIIFSPDTTLIQPKTINSFGGQIDVLPTVLGLLNFNYVNSTFGIDLIKEKRPFTFFSSDDKLGCIDNEHYYIYKVGGNEGLYDYKNLNDNNLLSKHKEKAAKMKKYLLSMIQAGKWSISNHKTDDK